MENMTPNNELVIPSQLFDSPRYLIELKDGKHVAMLSWHRGEKFLTFSGYWFFFNRAKSAGVSVDELLKANGFQSLAEFNKTVPLYERLTYWVSPEGTLLTRREYTRYQYRATKAKRDLRQYLYDLGFYRLNDEATSEDSGATIRELTQETTDELAATYHF